MVRTSLEQARTYGISWQSKLVASIVLMFAVAPNFDKHPRVQQILLDEKIPPNERIDQFWIDAYKAYFPGGKNDDDVALIEVEVRTIEYWDGPGSWIGKSIAFLIARVTRSDEPLGENKMIRVRKGAPRKRAGERTSGPPTGLPCARLAASRVR